MALAPHPAPWFEDPRAFDRLRELLVQVGFTDGEVLERLKAKDTAHLSDQELPLWEHRTAAGTPLDLLIRLFLLQQPVSAATLREAFEPAEIDGWLTARLLVTDPAGLKATIRVVPFQGMHVAFDLTLPRRSDLPEDYVMGIGSSSLTVARFAVKSPSHRSLDLGTGCGILALLAARYSDQVVAIDLNPRAVAMARFNARLNGLTQVEPIVGDLFQPVAGQTFDRILSNPPFVISPDSKFIYRDSGLAGDEITRRILREAPALLNDDGYCQLITNWSVSGRDPRGRVAEWLADTGCDAWVKAIETVDAATYASTWIRHTEGGDPEHYARRFAEWMAYYEKSGIEAITGGVITLRKRAGQNWVRIDEVPDRKLGDAGLAVERVFAAQTFLSTASDQALLAARLRLSPDARMHQACEPTPEGWGISSTRIDFAEGIGYTGEADMFLVQLLGQATGARPIGAVLTELAARVGADPQALLPGAIPILKRLVEQGFLLPT